MQLWYFGIRGHLINLTVKTMKSIFMRWLIPAIVIVATSCVAHAQFGIGLGLAAAGDNLQQAGGELADLFRKDSITYGDVSGSIGFYVTGKGKLELGKNLSLIGDISYVYFQSSELTLTDATVNQQDSTVSATFDVGTSLIPIGVGAEAGISIGPIRPYVGAQGTYTFVNRTYAYLRGAQELKDADIGNKSAGDGELGVAISGGVQFGIGPLKLDAGARYNLANALTTDDGEQSMRYLQVGVAALF
jgi:hypothetical protein